MRTLWNVFSFLAVVHLLALLMMVGWLWHSQRLNSERVSEIRELLSITVPAAKAAAAKEAQALAEERVRQIEEARRQQPGLDSAGQLATISLVRRQEEQTRQRILDEKRLLLQQLAAAEAALTDKAQELDRERAAWDQAIAADRTRKIDEQFLQTVRQYEQATPKQAKQMLMELIEAGNMDQAVAYLDAMSARAATKIVREFKEAAEIELAAKLLEELRTFGLTAGEPAVAPNGSQDARDAPDARDPSSLASAD